ncbi:MAG: ATP synthase F1 subunit gamma [Deltaproteobacteria bacterium]|nr:ATP synthase F1 subunit gamma [Deltaproteobacteria bacterium]MBW2047382.1 ATP synthase F1 subunit gamma [Deltaproteobacteria bacterium]MBW2110186.1 ATP synthase F1 subunit gamma [Deltaproteobacteria bacterium]MBW2352674.1 ATP synthase F1 subunit gamma [Deltaproteobacteria bacterium]HDZ91355.1 ATP synthase F1 subunit gamma [Deltaproteobacteria bacterium]
MATLREIQQKIGAVRKTRQITKAMNMVAAAKLRGAQMRMEGFEPYATKFAEVLGNLAARIEPDIHPLLVKRESVTRVELLHFTGDRGLCGSFNANLINQAEKWIKNEEGRGAVCKLTTVGKKGGDYFAKRNYEVIDRHVNLYGKVDISFANKMTAGFIDRYSAGEADEVYLMYSRFVSMSRQVPTLTKLIPIEPPRLEEGEQDVGGAAEYLCEPDPEALLIELLPKHISVQIYNAFLQNETSEHAARMAAMDNASKNCNELIDSLTLVYNKARQAAITAELMDIVGGAEALKG